MVRGRTQAVPSRANLAAAAVPSQTLFALYPNYIQIVATADSGIKTLADLKGKSLSVGAPKSGTELVQARVKGSGAGMEPPPDARLVDGWFQWKPARAPMPEVVLGNSGAAGEWRLCSDGNCRTLSEILGHPVGANVTTMRACER